MAMRSCFAGPAGLLLAVLSLLRPLSITGGAVACRLDPYCSWRKTQGYVGPLDDAASLKTALDATAYKQEIIVTAESRVDGAAQYLQRYRRAGWSHILIVMERPGLCHTLVRLMAPYSSFHGPVSCGWYRLADPDTKKVYAGWIRFMKHENGRCERWRKWYTTGRAVQLGYNVLAVDSDTVVLEDWYLRAKAPPLRDVHMMSQAEGDVAINGGFTYIQNVAPNGPVAWVVYEAVHRAVRWSENSTTLRAFSSALSAGDEGARTDDQTMLTESMLSALAGRPTFFALLHRMPNDHADWRKLFPGGAEEYDAYHWRNVGSRLEDRDFTLVYPDSEPVCDMWPCMGMPPKNGSTVHFKLRTGTLQMPHAGGVWPNELGGNLFPEPGPYTKAYRDAYKELAAFGVPPLVDPEDPAQLAAARSMRNETFALLSTSDRTACTTCDALTRRLRGAWIEGAWSYAGRWGHWHSHLYPLHKPAIGHVHVGTLDGTSDTKNYILKLTEHWDWKLAARTAGGAEHTFAATAGDKDARRDPEALGHVLAYAPGVVNWRLTKDEFLHAVEQLARVAVALGAVAAWPAAPCDADWVLNEWARNMSRPIRHTIPWTHINSTDVVMPFGDSLAALQCEWTGFIHKPCLASPLPPGDTGRGLLAVEFRSLLTWVATSSRVPSANNTIVLGTTGPASEPPPLASVASTNFTRVSYADLLLLNSERVLQSLPLPEVVWLDRLVEVEQYGTRAEAKFSRWREKCRVLRYRGSDMASKVKW